VHYVLLLLFDLMRWPPAYTLPHPSIPAQNRPEPPAIFGCVRHVSTPTSVSIHAFNKKSTYFFGVTHPTQKTSTAARDGPVMSELMRRKKHEERKERKKREQKRQLRKKNTNHSESVVQKIPERCPWTKKPKDKNGNNGGSGGSGGSGGKRSVKDKNHRNGKVKAKRKHQSSDDGEGISVRHERNPAPNAVLDTFEEDGWLAQDDEVVYYTDKESDKPTAKKRNRHSRSLDHTPSKHSPERSSKHSTKYSHERSPKQSTMRSSEQSSEQSSKQSTKQSTKQSAKQSTKQSVKQSVKQSTHQRGVKKTHKARKVQKACKTREVRRRAISSSSSASSSESAEEAEIDFSRKKSSQSRRGSAAHHESVKRRSTVIISSSESSDDDDGTALHTFTTTTDETTDRAPERDATTIHGETIDVELSEEDKAETDDNTAAKTVKTDTKAKAKDKAKAVKTEGDEGNNEESEDENEDEDNNEESEDEETEDEETEGEDNNEESEHENEDEDHNEDANVDEEGDGFSDIPEVLTKLRTWSPARLRIILVLMRLQLLHSEKHDDDTLTFTTAFSAKAISRAAKIIFGDTVSSPVVRKNMAVFVETGVVDKRVSKKSRREVVYCATTKIQSVLPVVLKFDEKRHIEGNELLYNTAKNFGDVGILAMLDKKSTSQKKKDANKDDAGSASDDDDTDMGSGAEDSDDTVLCSDEDLNALEAPTTATTTTSATTAAKTKAKLKTGEDEFEANSDLDSGDDAGEGDPNPKDRVATSTTTATTTNTSTFVGKGKGGGGAEQAKVNDKSLANRLVDVRKSHQSMHQQLLKLVGQVNTQATQIEKFRAMNQTLQAAVQKNAAGVAAQQKRTGHATELFSLMNTESEALKGRLQKAETVQESCTDKFGELSKSLQKFRIEFNGRLAKLLRASHTVVKVSSATSSTASSAPQKKVITVVDNGSGSGNGSGNGSASTSTSAQAKSKKIEA
jgi:hypothetical protein